MMKTPNVGEEPWVKDVHAFLSRGPGVLMRLRGLPYECTALQVVEFFRRGEQPSEVMDAEEGVFFVKKTDGKSTGDAFVLFRNESEAKAALCKQRQSIGSRYIELFRTSFSEMEQVVRRTLEAKSRPHVPRAVQVLAPHTAPPQAIPCGSAKDCIRLRGLPFEAQVQHILDFLGPHSKSIVYHGVHMVYNVLGQPTGEVFVQMDTEASASRAAAHCNNGFMVFGKNKRYVDVFQCSGEDVAALLTEAPPLTTPAVNEIVPTMISMYPATIMDPGPTIPSSPTSLQPAQCHQPINTPVLYVILSNPPPPEPTFFTPPPIPEWIPEYPVNQPHNVHHPDYFVS